MVTITTTMKNWGFFLLFLITAATARAQSTESPKVDAQDVAQANVKVFPNPATNVVNILGLPNTNKATVSISDIYGNEVLKVNREIRNGALSIPIPNLDNGFYAVTIHTGQKQVRVKFYKQ